MHLTDSGIRKIAAPDRGNRVTYDATVRGFGLRVTANGARSFVLNYRRKVDGRERRVTIGSFPDWSAAAAREEAKQLKRAIDGGADPVGDQESDRAAPSVAELCARFVDEHVPRKRASTQRDYRGQIRIDILPGSARSRFMPSRTLISRRCIDGFLRGPDAGQSRRGIVLAPFSLAVRWGMRTDNPVRGIERNQEGKRERYLSGDELGRLSHALAELPDRGAANAVRLLLLTGARRGELLAARWSDFDLEVGAWTKPASTTKQSKLHRVPLSEAACELLADMRKADPGVYLFPSPNGRTAHRRDLDRAWRIVRAGAGFGM